MSIYYQQVYHEFLMLSKYTSLIDSAAFLPESISSTPVPLTPGAILKSIAYKSSP